MLEDRHGSGQHIAIGDADVECCKQLKPSTASSRN